MIFERTEAQRCRARKSFYTEINLESPSYFSLLWLAPAPWLQHLGH
jgi:hypothetical protein